MKTIIIGGGVMGLCAAWALRKRGHDVALYDQAQIPNPNASSVDQHRLIRYPYGAQDGYCRMVADAFAAWDRVWGDLGQCHYAETGTLALSSGGEGWGRASLASLEHSGVAFERLDAAQIEARFPHLNPQGLDFGLYLPTGGTLFARSIIAGLKEWLILNGGAVHESALVAALDTQAARVTFNDGREEAADHLIIAAGPWVVKLLPRFKGRVTPSRQIVLYLTPPDTYVVAWGGSPMILDIAPDRGFYAVPPRHGHGFKIGDHRFSLKGDPDAPRRVLPGEAEMLLDACASRLRDIHHYRMGEAKVCFYDVEAQERFILEPDGACATIMTGFSGHGFKFGPLMGEGIAACLDGEISIDALTRYAAG